LHAFEIGVGRLVELSLGSPLSLADFEAFRTMSRLGLMSVPGQVVVVADLTQLDMLSDDVADQMAALLKRDSPKVARGGYLAARAHGTSAMHLGRMFRDAGNDSRRIFFDSAPLSSWLSEVLEPLERARLQAFLEIADERSWRRKTRSVS
jgi:hypothetical protein